MPSISSSLPFPAKLVVSVPFDWEEKPGKPLQLDLVARPATYSKDDHLNIFKTDNLTAEDGSVWNANWQSASETDGRSSPSSSSSSTAENVATGTSTTKLISPQASSLDENNGRDDARVRGDTTLAKRTLTLQELMLLSRQLSCRMNRIETKNSVRPIPKVVFASLSYACRSLTVELTMTGEDEEECACMFRIHDGQ